MFAICEFSFRSLSGLSSRGCRLSGSKESDVCQNVVCPRPVREGGSFLPELSTALAFLGPYNLKGALHADDLEVGQLLNQGVI